ncbi:iron permease [Vineibacter terrae]|uniref:Iron permease n=1 Tax=Vineibacter terrae TaxID=2586908 RepID=A0A5C8PIY3_9HYPH|nr:FTR1 family protein [Vineibacter terrae]TXL73477.1 iron permease [Vineibacter terrae]
MSQVAVMVFREALEIVVVAALLLAATRGVPGRWLWAALGAGAGILGASIIAFFAEQLADAMAGSGQDIFQAFILLATAGLVAWTIAWMRSHGREIATQARDTGRRIAAGTAPRYLMATAIGVSILRDGTELAVFLVGAGVAGQQSMASVIAGFAIGIAGGVAVGILLYRGVMAASLGRVFNAVAALLAFLGAGLASQAIGILCGAGWLPSGLDPVWDTEDFLSQGSDLGRFLHTLLGYMSQPSATQLLTYGATLALVLWLGFRRLPPPAISR